MHHFSTQRAPDRSAWTFAGPRPAAFHAAAPARSGPRDASWGRHVVAVTLGPHERMLFAPPSSGATAASMRPLAAGIASRHRPSDADAAGLLVRVPALEAGAGTAVLHTAAGKTAVYALEGHLSPAATARISALAGQVETVAAVDVTVVRVSHAELVPEFLHPAVALATAGTCSIVVCERLVSREMADAIGLLFTAQASYRNAP